MKKKTIYLIVIILFIITILSIGTYALLLWQSEENTELSLKIGDFADVIFSNGNDLNINNIGPVFDYEKDGEKTTFSVNNLTTDLIDVDVSLNITTISDNLKEESFKYVLLSSNDKTNYKKIAEGNFASSTNNSVINLVTGDKVLNTMNYKLIIYIDGNMNNPITMPNGSLTGFIEVTADGVILVTDEYMAANTEITTTEVDINYVYVDPVMTEVTLNPGVYKLEVWGSHGGISNAGNENTIGGYSYGTLTLSETTNLYVYVGGWGCCSGWCGNEELCTVQGFNGGGEGTDAFGGGATDIRIGTDSLYSRVIVAGGGGATNSDASGFGGGLNGGNSGDEGYQYASGGTQISGGYEEYWAEIDTDEPYIKYISGSFGQGGTGKFGGGGGWYGGAGESPGYVSAGGGSGWVYTESSFNAWQSGNPTDAANWLLNSSYYLTNAETIAIDSDQDIAMRDALYEESGIYGCYYDGIAKITGTEIDAVYTYLFPRLLGLTDLTLSRGTSVSLTDNVTIECETGGTSCNLVGPEITDTSTLSVGTHTIYYVATDSNGKKYKYERTVIVS